MIEIKAIKDFLKQCERRTYLLLCLLFTVLCIHGGEARNNIDVPTFLVYKNTETVQAAVVEKDPLYVLREELADSLKIRSMLFSPQEYVKEDNKTRLDQAVDVLGGIGVISDGQRIITEPGYKDVIVSRAEAVKILVLIKTLRTPVVFNELLYHDGANIYEDMRRDARYTSYILYAHDMGWLDGFEHEGLLKPLSPLTYNDYSVLVENMGAIEMEDIGKHTKFITKQYFLESIIGTFSHDLKPILVLYGNNSTFYQVMIKSIIGKEIIEQKEILKNTLKKFSGFSEEALLSQQGFSRYGIVLLIEAILEE